MRLTDKQRQMVEDNIKLAYYMANKYMKSNYNLVDRKGLTLEDLNQVALEQLCISVKTYNPEISKFSTYAGTSMYFKITKFVKGYNQIRIPRQDHWGRDIYRNELKQLNNIMQGYVTSLDAPVLADERENTFYGDLLGEDDFDFDQIDIDDLLRRNLGERDFKILKLKLQGKAQIDIAKTVGISQAQVSRILIKANKKLEKEFIA